jgi:hypothetical protein
VFAPLCIPGRSGGTVRTRAYIDIGTRQQWISAKCSLSQNPDRLKDLASNKCGDIMRWLCEFMENNVAEFPTLVTVKSRFSFRNGWYDAEKDAYWAYEGGAQSGEPDRLGVCCHHFDADFPEAAWRAPVAEWRDIRCTGIETIFGAQGLMGSADEYPVPPSTSDAPAAYTEYDIFTISVGRGLRWVNDGQSYALYLLGPPRCGKSVLIKFIANMYAAQDQGELSANGDPKWQLSGLVDKLIVTCQEMTDNFRIASGELLQMLEAQQTMCVNRKNKNAIFYHWKTPIFLAGNQLLNNGGVQYNLARRLVGVTFLIGRLPA